MINRRFFGLIFIFSLFTLSGLELGFEVGHSNFRYAEVGDNSKDDLYTLSSILLGVEVGQSITFINIKGSFSAELPYDFTFTDALGSDEANYLDDLFYFGINSNLSIGYTFLDMDEIDISLAVLLNFDYFYFQDMVIDPGCEYIYSILGAGPEITLSMPLSDKLNFDIGAAYIFNFLPLYERGGEFMWSDNIMITAALVLELGNE